MPEVITDNIDLWSSALLTKSTAGRGNNGRVEAYGIKKLRELILELAVRGKLVPQDPDDEPASVLLEKIARESKLLKKSFPDIGNDEKPFGLPQGWQWVRFGTVALHNSGKTLDRGRNTGQLRDYITTSNLYWGRFDLVNIRKMPIEDEQLEKCTARKGDLLICEGGEAGRAAVWPYKHEVCFQNHVHRARFYGEIDPYYVYRFFEKLNATGEIDLHRKGVGISNMSSKALALIVFPLPPLAEQHRIVAKVDELMALCDQLEQQQTSNIEAHQTLVETLLGTLTSVESQEEFTEAWTRIASHFDTLFTTEKSIDQFKQTILQLAVMGKLVPQDPDDEPASVLLTQIAAHKVALSKDGKLRGPTTVVSMAAGEGNFELPPNWTWVRFGEIMVNRDGERIPVSMEDRSTRSKIYDYYGASGVIDKIDGYLFDKPLLLIGEDGANLINRSTPIAFIARGKYWVNNHAHVLDGISEDFLRYIELYINSINLEKYVTGTAQPKMNQAKMNSIPIALPPLSEQCRIIAKVNELMALCDTLKARLAAAQTTQLHLADTIVEQAVA